MSVETSERFLSVDGSGKRAVKIAFDENKNKVELEKRGRKEERNRGKKTDIMSESKYFKIESKKGKT